MRVLRTSLLAALLLTACGSSQNNSSSSSSSTSSTASTGGAGGAGTGGGTGTGGAPGPVTTAAFDLGADLGAPAHFYDFPYPSDLRLTASGTPDLTGLPYPSFLTDIAGAAAAAMQHPGFPSVPVAYFRFAGAAPDARRRAA